MKIMKSEANNVTVLALKGKVTIGAGDVALRDAIDQAVKSGQKQLLVDLGGVSKMDSSGLGELVAAHVDEIRIGPFLHFAALAAHHTAIDDPDPGWTGGEAA